MRTFHHLFAGASLVMITACSGANSPSPSPQSSDPAADTAPIAETAPMTEASVVEPDIAVSDYASFPGQVLGEYEPTPSPTSTAKMTASAQAFLDSLTPENLSLANLQIDDPERREWTNSPARGNPGGIALGNLDESQLEAAYALLASVLSQEGYQKLRAVMLGDDLRAVIDGERNHGVGIEDFRLVVFGAPSAGDWGLQLDGHHVALNVSVTEAGAYSMSPTFIGTFPQSFTIAGKEYRPLGGEIDIAYEFLAGLTSEQRAMAIVADTRQPMRVGARWDGVVPAQVGLSGATLDAAQQETLLALVDQWLTNMPAEQADEARDRFQSGLNETTFAWNGPSEPGQDISYFIQGPTTIIEFAHDNRGGADGGNPVDHVHTIYRDFSREYGGANE